MKKSSSNISKLKLALTTVVLLSSSLIPFSSYAETKVEMTESEIICANGRSYQSMVDSCHVGCLGGYAIGLRDACMESCIHVTSGCPRKPQFKIIK